jgi:hypothetical protein
MKRRTFKLYRKGHKRGGQHYHMGRKKVTRASVRSKLADKEILSARSMSKNIGRIYWIPKDLKPKNNDDYQQMLSDIDYYASELKTAQIPLSNESKFIFPKYGQSPFRRDRSHLKNVNIRFVGNDRVNENFRHLQHLNEPHTTIYWAAKDSMINKPEKDM